MADSHAPSDSHGDGAHGHDDHGHGGVGKYVAVFLALCVLTAISFGVANSPIMKAPTIAWVVMMAVSVMKALLVMLFFMHLIWEANWKYILTIPATMMSIFLVLALVPDIGMRYNHYTDTRLIYSAEIDSAEEHDVATQVVHETHEHEEGEHDPAHKGDGHDKKDEKKPH